MDLLDVVQSGDIAYFNLNADARPELSRMVGAAVVMDLVSIGATIQRRHEYRPTVLLFDDVQGFGTEAAMAGIASLSARGREPGMMLLLGTQSLSDLEVGHRDGVSDQLLDNRSNLVVHRLPGYNSASRASRELGDHEQHRLTEHLERGVGGWRPGGTASRRSVSEPDVHPRNLMELPTGVAAVRTLGQGACLVRIPPPE